MNGDWSLIPFLPISGFMLLLLAPHCSIKVSVGVSPFRSKLKLELFCALAETVSTKASKNALFNGINVQNLRVHTHEEFLIVFGILKPRLHLVHGLDGVHVTEELAKDPHTIESH